MTKLKSTVYFYIPKHVSLLDLSGVVEVFQEANNLVFNYQLKFVSSQTSMNSNSGLELSSLTQFTETNPQKNDIIFVSGFSTHQLAKLAEEPSFFEWLQDANKNQATICSVCTGAFLLAKSGLLDHKECTTHWKLVEKLKKDFPLLKVQTNTLYTKSDNVYTSAGIVTGIDLALFIIEERHGKEAATAIAKELVVYKRRNGSDEQESVYLQNRNHRDEKIHTIQDWIIYNLEKTSNIEFLADLVFISPRNLTRIFKKETGITIAEYRTKLRIEKAKSLLANSDYKIEHIAHLCGYKTSKQLRVVLDQHVYALPTTIKNILA
ncbi:DJ-1/PfpI family protein [Flavobacterium sp. ANB]|uniref:GlxA family transcriptional regulator n=1 Tax=unclassified Flavobacterium TaxID=196869 RepID=UPI0012B7673C|nr:MULTISPECIES: DJ-1/PfpI family protein [unclassified Flavobacterium]MBF4515554.1 DJ-1/PfpI family protein [Flavobacterium sp. ANB]MTD68557.1 helix-turn-helix domain-containing protein [Flavobacterium sp. LC2016-13]